MKLLKRIALSMGLGTVGLAMAAGPALAATPYWANTWNRHGPMPVTVYWCAGGSGQIAKGAQTGKNVCGVRLPTDREPYVYVKETGTVLIETTNCGPTERVNFTSATDTGRTAVVYYGFVYCA